MQFAIYIVVFTLLQALFFGRIHLFGVATPFVYVYFVLLIPRNTPQWVSMLTSFVLGLFVDIFSNTCGLAATCMPFVAMLQHYFIEMFLRKEDAENFRPSLRSLGFARFLTYSLTLTAVYCLLFFSLEAFSFTHPLHWLMSVGSSLLLTLIMVFIAEGMRR